ncbi:MAG TPA: Gfo/Idh/MocA family oxidoreductase [Acidimicrobiales bacterium]|nr:Gfo/Idh/MocA family oxidoreductase [Acidimicrobiales bacterium]HUB70150.1 Gfo/Idh/MocA family oxidoreductase [Acidimicrobiales bacterium]
MRTFKLAIIGCGGVSALHAEAYARHPERARVVAAVDPQTERAEQLASQFPGCRAYASVSGAVTGPPWDIGVVCSPTPVRSGVVAELARSGKHVFVEKPFADNLLEATHMVEECESAGVQLAVHQNFRYHYPFDLARSLIGSGRIGRVTTVAHRDLMLRRDEGWRTSAKRHSLAVMGVHWLDGFRWMLEDEPVSVWCLLHSSPLIETAGDSDALVQATFAGGATVSYVQSFSCPIPEVGTTVIGESGSLSLDYQSLREALVAQGPGPVVSTQPNPCGSDKPEATFLAIEELLKAIESDGAPSNSGRDNLATVRFLEAAYLSADQGGPVAVTPGRAP